MIRKRIALLDDETIYRLIVAELLPFTSKAMPGLSVQPDAIKRRLDQNVTFMASRGLTVPYGFISIRAENGILFIDMLALDRKKQNKGCGVELMEFAERFGEKEGCSLAQLYVDDTNHKAIRFYKRLGYDFHHYISTFRCFSLSKRLLPNSFISGAASMY